ncbi:MAG TPA: hypothetical protein VFR17_03105, partial [Mycobacterium sp.]|nr:hypothetical protein [Mycobacterium sp.]
MSGYAPMSRSTVAIAAAGKCWSCAINRVGGSGGGSRPRGAALAAGALAVALTASAVAPLHLPRITAAHALSVALTSSDANPFQSEIDAVAATEQQIVTTDSAYPFLTDLDKSQLPSYAQEIARGNGPIVDIGQYVGNPNSVTYPLLSDANGATSSYTLNSYNADNQYYLPQLGDKTYVITVDPHPGTEDMTFDLMKGDGNTSNFVPVTAVDLSKLTPNADGSYTIYASPTEHSGNWIDTSGVTTFVVRNTGGDWGLQPDTITFQLADGGPTFTPPVLTDNEIEAMLQALPQSITFTNSSSLLLGLQKVFASVPENTFTPIESTVKLAPGPLLPGQLTGFGRYSLEPDQALIVKVPDVDNTMYTGFQISNNLTAAPNVVNMLTSYNNTQAFNDPDGFTYYVISSQDPGFANWLDDSADPSGIIWARFQGTGLQPPAAPITTQVVNVDDVSKYLPADTPTVTPAERAVEEANRVLEWDYRQDNLRDNSAWLTSQLESDQMKAAIGTDNYDKIFGTQADVPSIADRLTSPELSPDMTTVFHDLMTNPTGSLSAIVHNLPLLLGDITWPQVLAALRMDYAAAGVGGMTWSTALSDTFSDPSSSITAGWVNAWDDLATSIMNAGSYSPLTSNDWTSVSDQISQLEQSASQALASGSDLLSGHATDAVSTATAAASD